MTKSVKEAEFRKFGRLLRSTLPKRQLAIEAVAELHRLGRDLDAALREPFGNSRGRRAIAVDARAGLSKFGPDPLDAFDRIKAERTAA